MKFRTRKTKITDLKVGQVTYSKSSYGLKDVIDVVKSVDNGIVGLRCLSHKNSNMTIDTSDPRPYGPDKRAYSVNVISKQDVKLMNLNT